MVYFLKNILLPKSTGQLFALLLHVEHSKGNKSAARFVEGSPPDGDEPGCEAEADAPENRRSVRRHPRQNLGSDPESLLSGLCREMHEYSLERNEYRL